MAYLYRVIRAIAQIRDICSPFNLCKNLIFTSRLGSDYARTDATQHLHIRLCVQRNISKMQTLKMWMRYYGKETEVLMPSV